MDNSKINGHLTKVHSPLMFGARKRQKNPNSMGLVGGYKERLKKYEKRFLCV